MNLGAAVYVAHLTGNHLLSRTLGEQITLLWAAWGANCNYRLLALYALISLFRMTGLGLVFRLAIHNGTTAPLCVLYGPFIIAVMIGRCLRVA